MANALPKKTENENPSIRHFTIGSKWLLEGDCRFDATTYSEEVYAALDALDNCAYDKEPLSQLVSRVYHPTENQPRSNFKRIWVKKREGQAFLTGRQLFFFRPDREKYISRQMLKLSELQIPVNTILLSRSGTTGFPVLVNEWLSQFAVTDDAIRIFPDSIPIGFIYAFLSSSVGRPLMTGSGYGSTVSHIEAKHVTSIPVPLPPAEVQKSIHLKVTEAYRIRGQANALLDDAEGLLHELLEVSPFSEDDIEYLGAPTMPRAFRVSSRDLGIRLDATNHVPISRSALKKLQAGRFPLVQIAERVDQVYVAPRFARIYVDSNFGTPFLQGSHVPAMRPNDLKYLSNAKTEKMERWIIKKGWVLVTCSGTIGRTAVVSSQQDGWAASQHILRIMPREKVSHPGFIMAFLSTPFGQHQIQSKVYGAVIPELTAEDMAEVFIPDVPFEQQSEIGNLVTRAYELRDAANDLEDQAIAEMENVILTTKKPQLLTLVKKSEEPESEADRFRGFVKKVMSVPKSEIDKREAEYQAQKTAKKEPPK